MLASHHPLPRRRCPWRSSSTRRKRPTCAPIWACCWSASIHGTRRGLDPVLGPAKSVAPAGQQPRAVHVVCPKSSTDIDRDVGICFEILWQRCGHLFWDFVCVLCGLCWWWNQSYGKWFVSWDGVGASEGWGYVVGGLVFVLSVWVVKREV